MERVGDRSRNDRECSALLRRLALGRPIYDPVAIVAAHPDDETLGTGARMHCFARLTLIHLTDGAPRTPGADPIADAARRGALAAKRERELSAALETLGVNPERRLAYQYGDQESILHLREIITRLRDDLRDVRWVLTHPYEHGHPDHDTAAVAVHAACALLAGSGTPPAVLEFTSYHLARHGARYGVFWRDPARRAWVATLEDDERDSKARALACFSTQRDMLNHFPADAERYRRAPDYDFHRVAPPRLAWYDALDWPIDSRAWRRLARHALEQAGVAA